MSKKSREPDPLSRLMNDWEPALLKEQASDRPFSKPDRVAVEQDVLLKKYGRGSDAAAKKRNNPDSSTGRATLVRLKKKGGLDNEVNVKTWVKIGKTTTGVQG